MLCRASPKGVPSVRSDVRAGFILDTRLSGLTAEGRYATRFAPVSMPFSSTRERDLHFAKHGHEFGATDAIEYERMADEFMFGLMDADTKECIRPGNINRVRFGFGTHYEGVARIVPEFIRTFYPVSMTRIAKHGGEAGYFNHECTRVS